MGRLGTHLFLALFTVAGCLTVLSIKPGDTAHGLTIALGYLALIFLAATLLIGPLKLLRRKRNPVNIDLRRDTGIWTGITGLLHVYFGLQVHVGGQILLYFFRKTEEGDYAPQLNLFGLSNYVGAFATLALTALLVLSNDISLRRLKGPRWKLLQRANLRVVRACNSPHSRLPGGCRPRRYYQTSIFHFDGCLHRRAGPRFLSVPCKEAAPVAGLPTLEGWPAGVDIRGE